MSEPESNSEKTEDPAWQGEEFNPSIGHRLRRFFQRYLDVGKDRLNNFEDPEPVESSNVKSVGYDPDEMRLRVKFLGGGDYQYRDVPSSVYDEIMEAESKGSAFHESVRGEYPYQKLAAAGAFGPEISREIQEGDGENLAFGAGIRDVLFRGRYEELRKEAQIEKVAKPRWVEEWDSLSPEARQRIIDNNAEWNDILQSRGQAPQNERMVRHLAMGGGQRVDEVVHPEHGHTARKSTAYPHSVEDRMASPEVKSMEEFRKIQDRTGNNAFAVPRGYDESRGLVFQELAQGEPIDQNKRRVDLNKYFDDDMNEWVEEAKKVYPGLEDYNTSDNIIRTQNGDHQIIDAWVGDLDYPRAIPLDPEKHSVSTGGDYYGNFRGENRESPDWMKKRRARAAKNNKASLRAARGEMGMFEQATEKAKAGGRMAADAAEEGARRAGGAARSAGQAAKKGGDEAMKMLGKIPLKGRLAAGAAGIGAAGLGAYKMLGDDSGDKTASASSGRSAETTETQMDQPHLKTTAGLIGEERQALQKEADGEKSPSRGAIMRRLRSLESEQQKEDLSADQARLAMTGAPTALVGGGLLGAGQQLKYVTDQVPEANYQTLADAEDYIDSLRNTGSRAEFLKRYAEGGHDLMSQNAAIQNGNPLTGAGLVQEIRGGRVGDLMTMLGVQDGFDEDSARHYQEFEESPFRAYTQLAEEQLPDMRTQMQGDIQGARYDAIRELADRKGGEFNPRNTRFEMRKELETQLGQRLGLDPGSDDIRRMARDVERNFQQADEEIWEDQIRRTARGEDTSHLQDELFGKSIPQERFRGGGRGVTERMLERQAKNMNLDPSKIEDQRKVFSNMAVKNDDLVDQYAKAYTGRFFQEKAIDDYANLSKGLKGARDMQQGAKWLRRGGGAGLALGGVTLGAAAALPWLRKGKGEAPDLKPSPGQGVQKPKKKPAPPTQNERMKFEGKFEPDFKGGVPANA